MPRHVVLVGLPGSGKTTVGRLVAQRLNARFVDVDSAIEERAGKTVARIFDEDGESAFRALEAEVAAELLEGAPAVLAPGGGFAQNAALRLRALERALVIYLETLPSVAAGRLTGSGVRPLMVGYVPELRLRQMLERREDAYLEAQQRVSTDNRTAAEVADVISELARSEGGW